MKIGTIADLHIDRHNKKTSEDYLEANGTYASGNIV